MEEDDKSEVYTSESNMIANSTDLVVKVYPTKEQGQKKTKMKEKSSKYVPHDRNNSYSYQSSSRLFQPYRTLGIITSGKGFYVQSAGTETFLIVPIGDRFQVLRCDKLSPCLVSATVPLSPGHPNPTNSEKEEEEISQVIPDMSIGIALASHGNRVTLFRRMIHPIETLQVSSSKNTIRHMIYMGRTKQDVSTWTRNDKSHAKEEERNVHLIEGVDYNNDDEIMPDVDMQKRAAILVAVICSPSTQTSTNNNRNCNNDDDDAVPIVGDDNDDDTTTTTTTTTTTNVTKDEEDLDNSSTTSNTTVENTNTSPNDAGELLLLRVRERIEILRRIPLPFHVTCAVHPDTYLNKVLVGGPLGQLALINVNTGTLIHVFQCLQPNNTLLFAQKRDNTATTTASNHTGILAVLPGGNEDALQIAHETTTSKSNDYLSTITALTQSPAVDTVAVGTAGGSVHLINLKYDTVLFTLEHDSTILRRKNHNDTMSLFSQGNSGNTKKAIGITSLTFRTDGYASAANIAALAVGRTDGTISIWDLNTTEEHPYRRLLHEMECFHKGGVARCTFLPLEPILISAGKHDNCIAMHVFDSPTHTTSRVLRHRKGHASPPTFLRYLHPAIGAITGDSKADGTDAANCSIISGGSTDRTLRLFSTARIALDREWSQGKGLDKRAREYGIDKRDLLLPPITMIASSEARSRDFGDVVTIHQNHAHAYVWSSRKGVQSGPVLRQDNWNISAMKKQPPEIFHASSVVLSACGHFCLVGTKGGMIFKYNIQSGLPRGSYPQQQLLDIQEKNRKKYTNVPGNLSRTIRIMEGKMKPSAPANLDKKEAEEEQQRLADETRKARGIVARHTTTVVGLAVDSLNKTLLSVGSDGILLVWAFRSHLPHKKSPITLSSVGASKLCHIPESDLAAIALKDFTIVVLDCASLSIVRRLGNVGPSSTINTTLHCSTRHSGPISDMGFGPDGRRLFSSSFDGTIRVWDVPTGICIDWLSFDSPPTSLTISPTGEFLVTSHSDSVGLSVWCDKSFFHQVFLDGTPPIKPANMQRPCPMAEEAGGNNHEEMRLMEKSLLEQKSFSISVTKSDDHNNMGAKIHPKADGLVTLSGLPPGHWKNLFHLELIKERNKPKEPPKKPPSAPFFLQWREGEKLDGVEDRENSMKSAGKDASEEDVWNAVWSDDDDGVQNNITKSSISPKDGEEEEGDKPVKPPSRKRGKSYLRSKLADILLSCNESKLGFEPVTDYFSELGPSAIDIELTELCHGEQDEEGMELLLLASAWLLEACQSKRSFEAINAYLNRFLYLHSNTIAGIETFSSYIDHDLDSVDQDRLVKRKSLRNDILQCVESLRLAQREAANSVRAKMQNALCLLHNFSLIV